jgi:anaerobic selenocysteine-containing dehydrogenase
VTGELPVAVLAEEIETEGPDQIRALITIAGNPVLSTPHSQRLDAALQQLDLLVSVDLYLNETTRHADVVLPVPSQLEKSHYDAVFLNQTVRRVAKWSAPVFATEQPSEASVLSRLTLLVRGDDDGAPEDVGEQLLAGVLAQATADPQSNVHGRDAHELRAAVDGTTPEDRLVDALVRTGPWGDGFGTDEEGLRLTVLQANPHGIDLGPLEPRLPAVLRTPSAKIELAPPEIVDAIPELLAAIEERSSELVLVGRRDVRSNNSWMHNVDVLVRGRERCTLLMHPVDAAARGIEAGDGVVVRSRVGEVTAPVELTDDLMPGVVSLPHGWGHTMGGTRLGVASSRPGVNANVLTDGDDLDPISGNATLNGIPVTVERRVR